MKLIDKRSACLNISAACENINFPKATYYRLKHRPKEKRHRVSPRVISANERQDVLDIFHEERFVDMPVSQVFHRLLDEALLH